MGEKGYRFFLQNYTTEHTYEVIAEHLKRKGVSAI